MSKELDKETDLRRDKLASEVNALLKEFSSRPENKGWEASLEDDSIYFLVDVADAYSCLNKMDEEREIDVKNLLGITTVEKALLDLVERMNEMHISLTLQSRSGESVEISELNWIGVHLKNHWKSNPR
jgi:hypothetical protein